MTEIGPLLRAARGSRTIYRVERECSVSHSVISKAERGLALPTLANLAKLITYYHKDDESDQWVSALVRDRTKMQQETLRRMRREASSVNLAMI